MSDAEVAGSDGGSLPSVTGALGVRPNIVFGPLQPPPRTLLRRSVIRGTGATAAVGDVVTVHVIGHVWAHASPFVDTHDAAPVRMQAGGDGMIDGLDQAILGGAVGDRVVAAVPPAQAFRHRIPPDSVAAEDVVVFVVDILDIIPATAGGEGDAVVQALPTGVPRVHGEPGAEPHIEIPIDVLAPDHDQQFVVARGSGPPVVQGRVAAQVVVTDWAQTQLTTTWSISQSTEGAAHHLQVLQIEPGTALAGLVGIPVGSRVLVLVVQNADGEPLAEPTAAVIDIVVQM